MTPNELAKIKTIERAKNSLYFFSRRFLNYDDINHFTHDDLISTLQSESPRKLICMPRGSLKSSVACIAYPIWRIIRNPNVRILIDSELYSNSKNFIREIKLHLESPLFKTLFGNFVGPVWNEGEIIIKQRTRAFKEASITAGGVGTTKVGQHYDVIIGDDYNSPSNTNTPENAEKVIQHYRYNQSILEPTGTYVVIGTRYSELDLIGHILDHEVNQRLELVS